MPLNGSVQNYAPLQDLGSSAATSNSGNEGYGGEANLKGIVDQTQREKNVSSFIAALGVVLVLRLSGLECFWNGSQGREDQGV